MENKRFYQKSNVFYKKYAPQCIAASISAVLLIFIGVLPGFFYFPFLILTIPLIICPAFLGLHMIVCSLERKQGLPAPMALVGVPAYFGRRFRGCYRAVMGILKGLLAFIAAVFLVSFIYVPIALNVDPEFVQVMDQLTKLSTSGDEATIQAILNSQSIIRYVVVVFTIASLAFLVLFCWHLAVHAQNVVYRQHMVRGGDGGSLSHVFLSAFRTFGHEIKHNIRGISWISFGLIVIGYGVGVLVGYFIKQSLTMFMPLCGIIGAFSFLAFFAPYFDRYSNLVGYYYSFRMREFSVNEAEREFEAYRAMNNMPEEDLKMFKDALKKAKDELEQQRQAFDPWDYPADRE